MTDIQNRNYNPIVPFILGPKHGQLMLLPELQGQVFEGYESMVVEQDDGNGMTVYTVMVYNNPTSDSSILLG